MEPDLSIKINGITFTSPLLTASGTFGYGVQSDVWIDTAGLGGVVTKGLSLHPKKGNPPPRIWETAAGMLNSIGLENPGVDGFMRDIHPQLARLQTRVIANFFGHDPETYVACARHLDAVAAIDALEMNLSCPNVQAGGLQFGTDPAVAGRLVEHCRKVCKKPLWVKLSLAGLRLVDVARACVDSGADGLTLGNTVPGMAIDPVTRRPRLGGVCGGLSGPAIHPLAVRAVFAVARAELGVPLIGVGGVSRVGDVAQLMLAGASLVQVGTGSLAEPAICLRLRDELADYLRSQSLDAARDLIGKVVL